MSLGRLVSTSVLVRSTARNAARFHPTFRMFATPHVRTLKPRPSVTVGMGSTRSLSFWGSAPAPATSPPPPPPTPVTSEVLDDISQPDALASITPGPEPTSISEVVTSLDIPSTLGAAPLNYGDLAALGFSHWTPPGIVQWSMELIQVTSGMPWFWTIVTTTILSRLVVLPFVISSIRATAKLAPYQPRLTELREELQKIGNVSKDPIAVQRISLQQKMIYEEAGASLLAPVATLFVQLPVTVGMFLGIKKLCEFPLEQLKVGGYGWITDLTVLDPTYLLPLAMAAMVNVQLSVSAKDITQDAPHMPHLFNLFKAVAFITMPIFASFPAGVVVSLITGVVAITGQSILLRTPSVRKMLDIPNLPNRASIKSPTFLESVKFGVDWFKNRSAEAQAQQKAQARKKY